MVNLANAARGSGDSFKFNTIGDTLTGTIRRVQEREQVSQFTGKDETLLVVEIETGDGDEYTIWPRIEPYSAMGGAIADAVHAATGSYDLLEGGTLTLVYSSDLDTGKPQPAKIYTAKYAAPAPGANLSAVASTGTVEEPF